MSDPLKTLLTGGELKDNLFPPNSRYCGVETATMETAAGTTIVYLRRRFCPPPERFALLQEHTVVQGERLDNITARYLGDPEQFWRLCDANGVMDPAELTDVIGRKIRITLPEGIPGAR
ncbi:MAG: LysM domain-containing protein [Candidatus Aminicenantes bacterium]|nr:LysM domain-containing protein [Candidatus Aminicenantes bacterium]